MRSRFTSGGRRSKEVELRVPVLPRCPWQLATGGEREREREREREGGGGRRVCTIKFLVLSMAELIN